MRIRDALVSSKLIPLVGVLVTLRNAPAVLVHDREVELGIGMTLLSRNSVVLQRLVVEHVHAETIAIHQAQSVRGIGIT